MHAVLILDHAHVNGGQAKVGIDSALGLRARGHEVTVFAAVAPVDERLGAAGVEIVCLEQDDIQSTNSKLAFATQVMWNRKAARELDRRLATCDPARTVVHVHAWAKALSPSIFRPIARSGLASVYTMHEFFLVCPNGGFYDYPAAAICRRVPMSLACVSRNCDARSYPRKLMRVARHAALEHLSEARAAIRHVITISDLQHEAVRPFLPAATIFHRVDNPISVPDLGPKADAPLGEVLYVGRLSAEKGIDVFLRAAREAGIRPVLVGDGPGGGEIRRDFPEAVMLGWKSPDEVLALMREARALVFPSVWYEGQPLTVHEALAVGTPVIVSDVCAGREAVADGETGLWFRSSDTASLARALRTLADDDVARRMSRDAYARYWTRPLTPDRHLDRLEQVYAAVLADRVPRPLPRLPAAGEADRAAQ